MPHAAEKACSQHPCFQFRLALTGLCSIDCPRGSRALYAVRPSQVCLAVIDGPRLGNRWVEFAAQPKRELARSKQFQAGLGMIGDPRHRCGFQIMESQSIRNLTDVPLRQSCIGTYDQPVMVSERTPVVIMRACFEQTAPSEIPK
ncbi:hypothetical protein HPP92_029098 [Vanilla planifolia]|uniref:Uncharacterized protein n=1 Tax=Vanilla planifolia TaxID=51239 RepID=A0A835P4X6_VANPL|nr:hypothetical protein HPP92_029098 [Vanilla planifolia]KAG0445918.1 hypothetical protein HPP92_029087 [Vanilla planifolia]